MQRFFTKGDRYIGAAFGGVASDLSLNLPNKYVEQQIGVSMHTVTPTNYSLRSQPIRLPDDWLEVVLHRIAEAAPATDVETAFPEDAFGWLADAGLLAVTLPGHALDFNRYQTARLLYLLKRIGGANLTVGRVYEGHINALYLIHRYASPAQRTVWYDDVLKHHRLFSVWNTQAADGVSIRETADDQFTLTGRKTFCSGAGWVARPLVTGEWLADDPSRRGWQMMIVPTERVKPIPEEARFWQPLGMRASASFGMDFTGVQLDAADLLGQPGDYLRQPHFSGGAIRFAAVQLGGAEAIYQATRQFLTGVGRTDDVFQQSRLAEMAYLIESGNQWLQAAGDRMDQWLTEGAEPVKLVAYANMVRTAIEDICLRVMPLAERCVGARGLLRPQPFERLHRDLTLYLRQPAPDAALVDIGRYVLTQSKPAHDLWC